MTHPTNSTSSVPDTVEPVKRPGPLATADYDYRLFGGGRTDHYPRYRLAAPAFESVLAATLHRFDIRSRAFRICKAEFWPVHVGNTPEEVA